MDVNVTLLLALTLIHQGMYMFICV